MNNILDEITYSDGRIEGGCECSFVDSPAKLKLRARTFEGINKSINSRRAPIKESKFSLPNAFMPIDMNEMEDDNQSEGGNFFIPTAYMAKEKEPEAPLYTMIDHTDLSETIDGEDKKRLKVDKQKLDAVASHGVYTPEVQPVVEETTQTEDAVLPTVEAVAPVQAEVQEEPAIEPTTAVETPIVPPIIKEATEKEEPKVDAIDAIREKAYSNMAAPVEKAMNPVEEAMEMTELKRVEQSIEDHAKAGEEVKQANALIETSKKELEESQNMLEEAKREHTAVETDIKERKSIIDEIKKENVELRKKMADLKKKCETKNKKIIDATKELRKQAETATINADKIKKENDEVREEYGNKQRQTMELNATRDELAREESAALDEKAKLQNEYNELLEIYNAMDIPTMQNNKEQEVAEVSSSIGASVWDAPLTQSIDGLDSADLVGYNWEPEDKKLALKR